MRNPAEVTVNCARRNFVKKAAGLVFAYWASSRSGESAARLKTLSNPVGYATISWPEKEFKQALETISSLGFKGVQMLGWVRDAYSGPKEEELKQRLRALKLEPAALSCSKVRLGPEEATGPSAIFSSLFSDETRELRSYVEFAKRLGGRYLQVTDKGKPGKDYSADAIRNLAGRMNALGKIAQESGLTLGYHPHFNTLGETREGMGRLLDATDSRYVKLIADVAHMTLGGADPAEVIRTYHKRLIFCHFKDVRKDIAEQARQNRDSVRKSKYHFSEIGTGVVDFPKILQALGAVNFRGWVIVELDGYVVPPGGPAESARINKEAVRKLGFRI